MENRSVGILLLALLFGPAMAAGQEVRLAAAADLQVALPTLVKQFAQATGISVRPIYGSSGTLAAQIENGAPFDGFLSADIEYPRRLAEKGFAEGDDVVLYARGRLVLWTRRESGIDLKAGLKGLTAPTVRRIAIANPMHAPYGRAAVAALQHEGVYDQIRSKLVLGENISQTAQFADSGNADVAIIALALAVGPVLRGNGRHVEIPASFHMPIDQGAVWLSRAKNASAARRFVEFLRRPESVAYLNTMGFEPALK